MPRAPRFQVRKTPSGWMVNVPASLSESGKRARYFYKTRDEAKKHSAALRDNFIEHGSAASTIRPALAEDAVKASTILSKWGLSLTEAARRVATDLEKQDASIQIEKAGQSWTESFEGLRPRSITSYESTLRQLLNSLPGRVMSTISAAELESAITRNGGAAATYDLHRRNARAFWFWCAKKGWCEKALFDHVPAPRKKNEREIVFLSPRDAAKLLEVAEDAYPKAVPVYALALFAGIRAEELQKLGVCRTEIT